LNIKGIGKDGRCDWCRTFRTTLLKKTEEKEIDFVQNHYCKFGPTDYQLMIEKINHHKDKGILKEIDELVYEELKEISGGENVINFDDAYDKLREKNLVSNLSEYEESLERLKRYEKVYSEVMGDNIVIL